MTREKALKAAIRLLEEAYQPEEIGEIIAGLNKFGPASYRRKWTKQGIYDAVKLWGEIHGRCPTTKEMECMRELPGAFAVKREYKMGSRAFLDAYFPERMKNFRKQKPAEELLETFIAEYNRIRPKSARDYNERRDGALPTWNVVARRLGLKRWSELLLLSGVELGCLKQRGAALRALPETGKTSVPQYEVKRVN